MLEMYATWNTMAELQPKGFIKSKSKQLVLFHYIICTRYQNIIIMTTFFCHPSQKKWVEFITCKMQCESESEKLQDMTTKIIVELISQDDELQENMIMFSNGNITYIMPKRLRKCIGNLMPQILWRYSSNTQHKMKSWWLEWWINQMHASIEISKKQNSSSKDTKIVKLHNNWLRY